jgi:hypothetical protein
MNKRHYILLIIFHLFPFYGFPEEYCVEDISGIFREIYSYSNLSPMGRSVGEGAEDDADYETVLIFNKSNVYFELFDIACDKSCKSPFVNEFKFKYANAKGDSMVITVSKYKYAFSNKKNIGQSIEPSEVHNCGEAFVTIADSTTTNTKNLSTSYYCDQFSYGKGWELDVFEDVSPTSWGTPSQRYYMNKSTEDYRGYDRLPYRFLRAFVAAGLNEKQDYAGAYLGKEICVPKNDKTKCYRIQGGKMSVVGAFNKSDILSIVGSSEKFYNIEFYSSEYIVDTCLVRKGDVSLLKDVIK